MYNLPKNHVMEVNGYNLGEARRFIMGLMDPSYDYEPGLMAGLAALLEIHIDGIDPRIVKSFYSFSNEPGPWHPLAVLSRCILNNPAVSREFNILVNGYLTYKEEKGYRYQDIYQAINVMMSKR